MSKKYALLALLPLALILAAWSFSKPAAHSSLTYGSPNVQSLGVLAFGADNLLFAGDSQGATVFALDVNDQVRPAKNSRLDIQQIDQKIAALLGTTADAIRINDMAVHPVSKQVYLSVSRGQEAGQSVLLRVTSAGELEEVSLDGIHYSQAAISNAPAEDATDRRGRSLRTNTITDIAFTNGYLYVAGLSNEEFASNFRQLAFPFEKDMKASSLEIFHVAHGQYETHAPVRTFMPYEVEGKPQILAAYTCTPLVAFPVDKLKDGSHVKGKTVAELGFGNTPLDIVSFEKEGRRFILIANTNRTMMMIDAEDLDEARSLTDPLADGHITDGVEYLALPMVGVLQLDMLNAENFVILQRQSQDGSLRLRSYSVPSFG